MPIKLTPGQRSFLLDVKRHSRSLKQHYAARSLLAIDSGVPPLVVAQELRLPVSWVETWSRQYHRNGINYIVALGLPRRLVRIGQIKARRTRATTNGVDHASDEQRRRIQEITPGMVDLAWIARHPSARGADLGADPADLFVSE